MSNLISVVDYVLPEGSVLYKHNHANWSFYKDDRAFEDGIEYLNQNNAENFEAFINRLLAKLIQEEKDNNDPEPLVQIDNAIFNKSYYESPELLQSESTAKIIGEGAESEDEL